MTDILLATINAKWIHPSLALRLLKANLASLEERAEIAEFALRQPLPEKVTPILQARPRILALSVSIWNHQATAELLAALNKAWEREAAGKPVIVMGGPEVSWLDEDAAILRHADWVVRGEGEVVFRRLCELLLENKTPSGPAGQEHCRVEILSKLRMCEEIKSARGKFIEAGPVDPAAIKSAYRLYGKEDLERKLVYVEASRGCPFGCEFCLSALDRQVREFPLETFLAEMDGLLENGARRFKFLDRTFNLDTERAGKVLKFFLERTQGLYMPDTETPSPAAREPVCVHFEMVPSRLPAELRGLLARFKPGTLRLELGIQTFNPRTAALVGRASDPEKELETLEFLCRNTNAIIHADLIAGLPAEDLASFAAGFDRLRQALSVRNAAAITTTVTAVPPPREKPRTEIQLGILKRLPGTPIARHDRAFGMRYAADPPYEVRETAALSAGDLNRLRNFARFWELIVNRGVYPDFTARFLPPGKPAFNRFMELADTLLARFGRSWGIDKKELKAILDSQR
ncbi:MAG: B12-binding domain-containing radical SAM protein [Treponema sp.]|jgi:radical SAM superfamily enzyme YgiQ (UPF0313 family)|nr:B12-binding domain-containing radical SAM protein [Treponema sp.]